jgi:hypothetical protein
LETGDSPDHRAHVASPSGEQVQLNTLTAAAVLTLHLQELLLLLPLAAVINHRMM